MSTVGMDIFSPSLPPLEYAENYSDHLATPDGLTEPNGSDSDGFIGSAGVVRTGEKSVVSLVI